MNPQVPDMPNSPNIPPQEYYISRKTLEDLINRKRDAVDYVQNILHQEEDTLQALLELYEVNYKSSVSFEPSPSNG